MLKRLEALPLYARRVSEGHGLPVLAVLTVICSLAGCGESGITDGAGSSLKALPEASPQAIIYAKHCVGCHSSGVGGAPVMGDAAAWASRTAQGLETVYANAINGIRGMPLMGTCSSCSDADIRATVDLMLENSQ
ncbi:MAG: c-type cytochrome [Cellvibrionales bacterium]